MNNKKPGILIPPNPGADNNSLLQLAFNNGAQANIISITRTGKIVLANNAACTLTGYSLEELLNENYCSVFNTN